MQSLNQNGAGINRGLVFNCFGICFLVSLLIVVLFCFDIYIFLF